MSHYAIGDLQGCHAEFCQLLELVGFSAREGLDYVPYDNFPARLHKGERVQTAEEASGSRGPIHIHLEMNSREFAYAIADEAERNPRLRRRMAG